MFQKKYFRLLFESLLIFSQHALFHSEEKLRECAAVLKRLDEINADKIEEEKGPLDLTSDSGDDTDTKIQKLQDRFNKCIDAEKKKQGIEGFDPKGPVKKVEKAGKKSKKEEAKSSSSSSGTSDSDEDSEPTECER